MRNSLRRLLAQQSVQMRDPETDEPFKLASGGETWTYCDVRKTVLLPHGLYGITRLLLKEFLEGDGIPEDTDVGAIAGPALGGIPLAAGFVLAAYEYDPQNAPPMLLVRKQAKGHGTGNMVEGLDNVDAGTSVLVLEDVVTTGGSTIQTIKTLREAGLNPTAVLAVVDREMGGLDAIKNEGVHAAALFTLDELTKLAVEDHVWFRPDPAGGEGYYFLTNIEEDWQACNEAQNQYLYALPDEEKLGLDEEAGLFYVEGVLRL